MNYYTLLYKYIEYTNYYTNIIMNYIFLFIIKIETKQTYNYNYKYKNKILNCI
jgi:hypothetical protein